ncbi:MAG TPA: hypothetical protein VF972_04925 [Actinomycetota bacterium]
MPGDVALRIYLNDHLAGAVAAMELARRCLGNNRQTPLGMYLSSLIGELEADRRALEELMRAVGARRDPLKQAAGWLAEKVGRFKLNGRLIGYSDLSRLEELEALCLAVEGKRALWRSLAMAGSSNPHLAGFDLGQLERRARTQRSHLEGHRRAAARVALG